MGILKIGVVGCGRIGKLHINNLINSCLLYTSRCV